MKYRFVEQVATPDADAPTRKIIGWVALAVLVLVLVASAAHWARGPQEPPQAAQGLVTMPTIDLPDYYHCGAGFEMYQVQLSDADRAIIAGMVEGEIRLPWKVTGCNGLTDEEIARRRN